MNKVLLDYDPGELICYWHFLDNRPEDERDLFIQYENDALPGWACNVRRYYVESQDTTQTGELNDADVSEAPND